MWTVLDINDSLSEVRATRFDAVAGFVISVRTCRSRYYFDDSASVTWVVDTPPLYLGLFQVDNSRHALRELESWCSDTLIGVDRVTVEAVSRLVADLCSLLRTRFGGRLFRLLRRRVFCRKVRARIRAKLVLGRSAVFCRFPAEMVRQIGEVWL